MSSSDIFCACSKKPGSSMTSSTALAAATASGLPPKVEPCEPGVMPDAASAVARQAPIGKPPPSAFASDMTSGVTPRRLIGEQIAGAAHAGLHLVEHQQQAVVVAELAQRPEEGMRRGAHAAFALHRLDQDAGGVRADRLLDGLEIAERHLVEAIHRRPEAFEIFRRAGRGQRRQRAAVKRAFEGDDAVALGMALGGVIFARDLDRAFHRLGAGIGEEHEVGKALLRTAAPRAARRPGS